MKRLILISFFILISWAAVAQNKRVTIFIGVNPFGLAESAAAFGPSVSYRVSPKIELWAEASYLFNNNYFPKEWNQFVGARLLFQPRYSFDRKRKYFITPEIRYKSYSFREKQNFSNGTDTLFSFDFRERQILFGTAVLIGRKLRLGRKKRFFLEPVAGIGFKQRSVQRQEVPPGYKYLKPQRAPDSFFYNLDYETEKAEVTIPITVRLVYAFNIR